MTDGAMKNPNLPSLAVLGDDEPSAIRPRLESLAEGVPETMPPARRRIDSSPTISLNERIREKLGVVAALLEKLPPDDPYARLIHIALLRRDEALLDGVI